MSTTRIEELFHAALERAPEERVAFLEEACADDEELREEVLSLIEASGGSSELEAPAAEAFPELALAADDSWVGRRIGAFHLVRHLASGGMGAVFEAAQDEPRRKVALKLVRGAFASSSTQRRLRYEAEVLGRLKHPGIAQVYAAGIHREGALQVPYFVMEYVEDATNIVQFARAANLSVRQRVELFLRVCEAVEHGHGRGVVHRDLKPANLLVDGEGRPKVIDFGVARATDADVTLTTLHTGSGELVGTLQYMSPEQCAGRVDDLDVRSDVYSLGMVLYELLCGTTPYRVEGRTIAEAARIIREVPARRPSLHARALRGDLETIVLKALEKEPALRYRSAGELGDDLGRWLRGEPPHARPVGGVRRAVRWARRKPALAAVVVLALLAFVVAPTALYVQQLGHTSEVRASLAAVQTAREEEKLAHEDSDATLEFLLDLFRANDPSRARGVELTAYELLERGTERLEELEGRARLQARLLHTLGDVYRRMGDPGRAIPLLERALELSELELGAESTHTSRAMSDLAGAYLESGRHAEAEELFRRALELEILLRGEDHIEVAQARVGLGIVLGNLGRIEESIAELEEAERIGTAADQPTFAADVLASLAENLRRLGRTREALAVSERAVEVLHDHVDGPQPDLATALGLLAKARRDARHLEEADQAYADAIEMERRLYPRGHLRIAFRLYERSFVQEELGLFGEAHRSVEEAVAMVEELGATGRADFREVLRRLEYLDGRLADEE